MSTRAKTEELLLTIQTSLEHTQPEPLSRARLCMVARAEALPRPGALSRNQASNKPADTKQTVSVRTAMAKIRVPKFQHDSAYWLPLANKHPLSRVSERTPGTLTSTPR